MMVTTDGSRGGGEGRVGSVPGLLDRLFFTLVIVAGTLLGLTPPCLFVGREDWLLYVAAASLLLAGSFAILKIKGPRGRPGLRERLVAAVAAVFPAATFGLVAMAFYALVYWLARAINVVLGWSGMAFRLPAAGLGQLVAGLILFVIGFGFLLVAIQDLNRQLFPPAGVRSASAIESLGQNRRTALASLFLAGALLAVYLWSLLGADGQGAWRFVVLQLSILFATSYFAAATQRARREERGKTVSEAVGDLLRQAGLEVEKPVADTDPEAGGLLRDVDFLARGEGRTLLVDVLAEQSEPVKWPAVAALTSAAWALAEQRGLPTYQIEPFLVLVDTPAETGLIQAATDEGVKIVRLTKQSIASALGAEGDREQKRQTALGILSEAVVEGSRA